MSQSVSALQLANSVALPVLGRVGGTRFWETSLGLARHATRTLEERRAEQLRLVNSLLSRAARNVPLLRERLAGDIAARGLRHLDEMQRLPITSKADMMSGFPDRVVDESLDRSDWQLVSTSGTISRIVTVKNFARRDMERAAAMHSLRSGIRYEVGDAALWWPAPPDCADQSPRLRVVGRLDEILEGPGGAPVSPETLSDRLYDEGGCRCFRVRERDGRRLHIDYVPRVEGGDDAAVIAALRPLLDEQYRIKARSVRDISTEPSGKFRFIRAAPDAARRLGGRDVAL